MKRIFAIALAFSITLGVIPQVTYAAGAAADEAAATIADDDIVIVYTNDIHCGVEPVTDAESGAVTNIGYAGAAGFAAYAASIAGEENVTLVDAGDATQGEAIGSLSNGQYLVEIMNEMGYDIFVPGNHEFDYGMEQMQANMNALEGVVISSNFVYLESNAPVFDGYKIISYGDVDVAFVGVTTPESFTSSTPAYFQDGDGNYIYGFNEGNDGADLYAAVQASVDAAAVDGAEYIICVGHLGIDSASAPWRSTDVIANTTGIDAFIDGHSHSAVPGDLIENASREDVLLTQTGTKFANVGCMTISADGLISSTLISGYAEVDEAVDAFVTGKLDEFAEDLAEVVAKTDVALVVSDPAVEEPTRIIRSRETNLGDLVADAFRIVLGNGEGEPADVGLANGGGIRVDVPAGDITYGQIIAVLPYSSNIGMAVEATGQEIIDALEMSASALPGEYGGFTHISGITFTIDTSVESAVEVSDRGEFIAVSGERRVKDVKIGGEPVDLEAVYTVAAQDYTLKYGGDGINMFMDNEIVVQPVLIANQVLISYIQDNLGGVVGEEYSNPYGQGRITIESAGQAAPFTDVPAGSQYYESVLALYESGLVSGTGGGRYSPESAMTNAMAVTMLYNHAGKINAGEATGEWYADAEAWAYTNGILSENADIDFDAAITSEVFNEYLTAYANISSLDFETASSEDVDFTRGNAAILMSDFLTQIYSGN